MTGQTRDTRPVDVPPTIYLDGDPERTVLGYCLMIGYVPKELQGNLSAEDFSESYRLIARSLFAIGGRTGCCDPVSVSQELERGGAGIFTVREIGTLAEAAPVGEPNLAQLIRLIKERKGQPTYDRFTQPISTLLSIPDEPIPYLAERLLVSGANGFIGGEPKSLKSWLALYIGLCLSLGTPIFGRYGVPQRVRVLYLQEEDGERRVRRRISKSMACAPVWIVGRVSQR